MLCRQVTLLKFDLAGGRNLKWSKKIIGGGAHKTFGTQENNKLHYLK